MQENWRSYTRIPVPAELYADGSWARAGATLANGANSYAAIASDWWGRTAQDTVSVNLPAAPSYSYDSNGNLTGDGTRAFEYDFESQLTNVYVSGQWRSEFGYDAMGRRRVRREYGWSGGAWVKTNEVRYVYDGRLVIQERDAMNLALVTYTRGKDLSGRFEGAGGIGGLLARTDNRAAGLDAHAFYHFDGNGNVVCMINASNVVVARYTYDPFGRVLAKSGPLADANLYRFSSKEYHPNSGLVYYLYRYYEPNLQRWVNRDPIGEKGGYNLYALALNNVVERIDPYGECFGPPLLMLVLLVCEELHCLWLESGAVVPHDEVFHIRWEHIDPQPRRNGHTGSDIGKLPPWFFNDLRIPHDEWPTIEVPWRDAPILLPSNQRRTEPNIRYEPVRPNRSRPHLGGSSRGRC